mmetsp:Transcript_1970/g.3583  ORF Transcript_1970/g.3583 Transcript_1970/m.3583 type:complete len:261 (+) Transcript_1970:357-1139(+)
MPIASVWPWRLIRPEWDFLPSRRTTRARVAMPWNPSHCHPKRSLPKRNNDWRTSSRSIKSAALSSRGHSKRTRDGWVPPADELCSRSNNSCKSMTSLLRRLPTTLLRPTDPLSCGIRNTYSPHRWMSLDEVPSLPTHLPKRPTWPLKSSTIKIKTLWRRKFGKTFVKRTGRNRPTSNNNKKRRPRSRPWWVEGNEPRLALLPLGKTNAKVPLERHWWPHDFYEIGHFMGSMACLHAASGGTQLDLIQYTRLDDIVATREQ